MSMIISASDLLPGHIVITLEGKHYRVSEVWLGERVVSYHAGAWSGFLSPHKPVQVVSLETITLRVCECGHVYGFDHDKVEPVEMATHAGRCLRKIRLYSERIMS